MKSLMFLLVWLGLGGCALQPSYVAPEIVHMSHVTQHEPFTDTPTRYGANIAQLTAAWEGQRFFVSVSEGVNLNRCYASSNSCGEIMGPREQFTAKIGYKIWAKP